MIDGRIADVDTPRELKRRHGLPTIRDVFIRLVEGRSP